MGLASIDLIVFISYCVLILAIGIYVSRGKGGEKTAEDYFLAGKSLPWWAIGASLIAANISAEQFIGMSGSGFALGLAIASYEWMAAITLLVVAKYFLPIFIEKGLYTIPEFIEKRYSTTLKTILAVFWIALFVFVNLTTVLYLGGKALDTIIGTGDGSILMYSIVGLALFALAYSLWGGLAAVAWTDVVQVVILVFGGLMMTYYALVHVSGDAASWLEGLKEVYNKVPERFSMILSEGEIITPNGKDAWRDLPGIAVLVGGIWVANLYYWGFNQYIIQRTLAAKNLREGQKGIVFAAFLKLLIPIFVVLPGIIAYVMLLGPDGSLVSDLPSSFVGSDGSIVNDNASPWLIKTIIPVGLKGLILASLAAAIVSSLASMINSTSTIFTMDIYKPFFNKEATDSQMVKVGRLSGLIALVIALIIAPQLSSLGQVFQYIQEYTGIVSPGILAVFLMGLFYKKSTNTAAILGVLLSIPIALYFKVAPETWPFVDIPFMHQMLITCIGTILIIVGVSEIESKGDNPKAIILSKELFATSTTFNISAFVVLIITAALYAFFQ